MSAMSDEEMANMFDKMDAKEPLSPLKDNIKSGNPSSASTLDSGSIFAKPIAEMTGKSAANSDDTVIDLNISKNEKQLKQIMPDSGDMGMLQTLRFNMAKGSLTREHLMECTTLGFNTAYKHMVLQCSVGLAKANQEVLHKYLTETMILRKNLYIACKSELLSIADEYWSMIEQVAQHRAIWKSKVANLKSNGHFSDEEVVEFNIKADGTMRGLISKCEETAAIMAETIMDQVKAALVVKVEDLTSANPIPLGISR